MSSECFSHFTFNNTKGFVPPLVTCLHHIGASRSEASADLGCVRACACVFVWRAMSRWSYSIRRYLSFSLRPRGHSGPYSFVRAGERRKDVKGFHQTFQFRENRAALAWRARQYGRDTHKRPPLCREKHKDDVKTCIIAAKRKYTYLLLYWTRAMSDLWAVTWLLHFFCNSRRK